MRVPIKAKTISYEDIQKKLTSIPAIQLRETELFLNGDHWQNGHGWNGYRPDPMADTNGKTWHYIQEAFTPKNVCLGMVRRIEGAIFGKAPDFSIVSKDATPLPDPEEEKARPKSDDEVFFSDIDNQLVDWMDKRGVHEALKRFVYNKTAYGKAAIRIYIPNGYLSEGTLSGDFASVLDKIYVDTPHYENAIDDLDENYGEKYTILKISQEGGNDPVYEVCFIDPFTRQTILRQVTAPGTKPQIKPEPVLDTEGETRELENKDMVTADLGGNLLTFIAGNYTDAIISPTVKRQQRTVNKAKTGETMAGDGINFPDTTFINADIPQTETVQIGNQTVERPVRMTFGAGVYRFISGITTQDDDGNERITTPEVKMRDSADPEKFAKIAENNTRDMYLDAGMLYIYKASSPYPSGESMAESMTDYLILLIALKTLCDQVGVWLLTTVIRLVFDFTGEKNKNAAFKVLFSSKITIGRISNDDKITMMKEVDMGARTLRNYQIVTEVTDDPTGEVMAYLVEKKQGWHNNLPSTIKERELEQTKELALSAQETARATAAANKGNGNGNAAGK